jgi:hypothetical protein
VEDVGRMEVKKAAEKLVDEGFENRSRDWGAE